MLWARRTPLAPVFGPFSNEILQAKCHNMSDLALVGAQSLWGVLGEGSGTLSAVRADVGSGFVR